MFVVCTPSQIGGGRGDQGANLTKLGHMFKTFVVGVLLGICAAVATLYYVPLVDQVREQSFVVVHPNHGNTETFHVNIPTDQILAGSQSSQPPLPLELDWPQDDLFAGVQLSLIHI